MVLFQCCSFLRHNRQFRYEERDEAGVVHGRYGYYDQYGKLNIVNYTADPHHGFHAEGEPLVGWSALHIFVFR